MTPTKRERGSVGQLILVFWLNLCLSQPAVGKLFNRGAYSQVHLTLTHERKGELCVQGRLKLKLHKLQRCV